MRNAHWLGRNATSETPQAAFFIDTETEQQQLDAATVGHVLRFGWVAYQRRRSNQHWCDPEWHRFTTPADCWDWIGARVRPKTRTYLFAHSESFDLPVIDTFNQLPLRGWELKMAVLDGPPVILRWRKPDHTLTCLDTLNWWRVPLAKLSESLGVAKLPMPTPGDSSGTWDDYCRRDVEIIRLAVTRWWEFLLTNDLGGFAPTISAQAMRSYRHRFMQHKILIDDDENALALARDAYHGGRVEAYRIGRVQGPIHALDVNSLYPAVMRSFEYPTQLRAVWDYDGRTDLARILERYTVVARVSLDTDQPIYPLIRDGRLIFPVGRFETTLTTPELHVALQRRHLATVARLAAYERAPLFTSWVNELYGARLKARAAGDDVASGSFKLMMNSLYGKFGQRGFTWEEDSKTTDQSVRTWLEVDGETKTVHAYRQLCGLVQRKVEEGESRDSHPAIAAHVTAYGRLTLYRLQEIAGRENVYYCDTDSLYVNDNGLARLSRLCDQVRLGALKNEGTHAWIEIHGAKDYLCPEHRTIKGVRAKALEIAPGVYRQEKWSSLRGLLRSGNLSLPVTQCIVKRLSREYRKGYVDDVGYVNPYSLSAP